MVISSLDDPNFLGQAIELLSSRMRISRDNTFHFLLFLGIKPRNVFGFLPVFVFTGSWSSIHDFVFEDSLLCILGNVHVFGETVVTHPS